MMPALKSYEWIVRCLFLEMVSNFTSEAQFRKSRYTFNQSSMTSALILKLFESHSADNEV